MNITNFAQNVIDFSKMNSITVLTATVMMNYMKWSSNNSTLNGKMVQMFINNTKEVVKPQEFATEEEIISTVFEFCPQVVFSQILRYDFFNYINTIPERCNSTILQALEDTFGHIIKKHFIEVLEDTSFDYDYGDISSTHHCVSLVGYVPRNEKFEALAEDWFDQDFFF